MSFRILTSWMPARKSWASRIIGERAVRPIAVSTSASTEARVPATISTRIGSIIGPRFSVIEQIPESVDRGPETRETGTVEPNSWTTAGPSDHVAGAEPAAVVEGPPTVQSAEMHPAGSQPADSACTGGDLADLRTRDRPDTGHPQIDPFHLLVGLAAEVVAVQRVVRVVEGIDHRVRPLPADLTGRAGHPDLEGLPQVPQVGGPFDDLVAGGEALPLQCLSRLRRQARRKWPDQAARSRARSAVTAVRT